ncbi:LytTR family DNA-binding domain-containing protein [Flavobacterium sp. CLA17]|uniref:LytR/AlgR family response regulator transcription factor n=1 Tax=Flavobacterium sp. CLA17 TaxID=2724135 RepID=UPI001491C848|nr:LytTR family transcriptional regulator DNA-binding domain-containing protein [Flavobacterium sp. CLA17]QSB29138.1 LytTR family transcriptional regulator DNA-binding domain-containing protein [Flavobacterium sp. CLA17]
MKKARLYILTLAGISIVVLIVSLISSAYLYSSAKEKLWNSKLESGEREAREISRLLEQQLHSGLSKDQVIHNLQLSIENTDIKSDFICMYNQEGIELCHPNPAFIGQKIQEGNSQVRAITDKKIKTLSAVLEQGEKTAGMRTFPNNPKRNSEIVNINPVAGTNWMVASHANLAVLEEQLSDLYLQFVLSMLLSTLFISGCCYTIIRLIYRKYETASDLEKKDLNDKVNELQVLNLQLNSNQQKLQNLPDSALLNDASKESEIAKKRILTYHKDELIKLDTNDIAYILLDTGITCIYTFDNRQFNSNNSLDEIMKGLDSTTFYRANRQFIVNIRAINSILLYGKNQLKLIIKPELKMDVIISKNKVSEFKNWLDQ